MGRRYRKRNFARNTQRLASSVIRPFSAGLLLHYTNLQTNIARQGMLPTNLGFSSFMFGGPRCVVNNRTRERNPYHNTQQVEAVYTILELDRPDTS